MTNEAYCALQLRLLEQESFIAVGDVRVAETLQPTYLADLRLGKAEPLPDLLSVKEEDGEMRFRIREVKFKLEERLIEKAVRQLASGMKWLQQNVRSPVVDRLEIVVALRGRALKPPEKVFLGAELGANRFHLACPGLLPVSPAVTVLLL